MSKKSEREVLCNDLARVLYRSLGYVVPKDYDFSKATHPQEHGMLLMADYAYDMLVDKLSADDLIAEFEEDDESE